MSSRRKATPVRLSSRSPASLSLLSSSASTAVPCDDDLSLVIPLNSTASTSKEEGNTQKHPSSSFKKMIEQDHQIDSASSTKKARLQHEVSFYSNGCFDIHSCWCFLFKKEQALFITLDIGIKLFLSSSRIKNTDIN